MSPLRWLWFYPLLPFGWTVGLIGAGVLAYRYHWGLWVVAALCLLLHLLYWVRMREHFMLGCVNPAVVVSVRPMLIAVATDLTKGYGKYPVIKIIKKQVPSVCGAAPADGMRLATVALYVRTEKDQEPYWADFNPLPIDLATADMKAKQRVMDSISPAEWEDLRSGLEQVRRPYQPGLYRVTPASPREAEADGAWSREDQPTWPEEVLSPPVSPGSLRPQVMRWVRSHPWWPLFWSVSTIAIAGLAYQYHWSIWFVVALFLFVNLSYWAHLFEHFGAVTVHPSIVVSLKPMLIAVAVTVPDESGPRSFIKIIKHNLPKICGVEPAVGMRLATKSLNQPSDATNQDQWDILFRPIPIDLATGDLEAKRRVMDSIALEDWNALMSWLEQVPRPYRPGVYPVGRDA